MNEILTTRVNCMETQIINIKTTRNPIKDQTNGINNQP